MYQALKFLALWSMTWIVAADEPPMEPSTLESLGDNAFSEGDLGQSLEWYQALYEVLLPELRELDFQRGVESRSMSKLELRKTIAELVDKEYDNDDIRMMEESLRGFGLVPQQFDLRQILEDLYSQEIAGFYDPEAEQLYVIDRNDKTDVAKASGFFENGADEQKLILIHEMAHALHDQLYDLDKLRDTIVDNDDAILAQVALVEGDAMAVLLLEQQRLLGTKPNVRLLEPGAIDLSFGMTSFLLPFATSEAFSKAPKIFSESLIFPYHKGVVFVAHLAQKDGWEAVNQAWADVPQSTEQILHPEKYLGKRDDPVTVQLPNLQVALGNGNQLLGRNVMGEFQIRILLGQIPFATFAAAGWGGDQYATYADKDGKVSIVWFTNWDSALDARQFAIALQAQLHQRLSLDEFAETFGMSEFESPFRSEKDGRVYSIDLNDKNVVVLLGLSEGVDRKVVEVLMDETKLN